VWGSPWETPLLENFIRFANYVDFKRLILNTVKIGITSLIFTYPAPIIFAILLNELSNMKFRKTVQTISYLPYFLSWVVFGGIILAMLDSRTGIINSALVHTGVVNEAINFGKENYFWGIIIVSSLLKGMGWGSIIYFAAITGIDQQLYESAYMDGANRWHRIRYITLPCIAPTIVVFFILSVSGILNNGFDQIWIFQNQTNLARSEVLDTMVYKYGVQNLRYSYTTAIGLFKSILAMVLLWGSNLLCKKITDEGLL
jgi:putative aldouronate transport system permease protein